jgi:outer membrane protein assembly factor BamA
VNLVFTIEEGLQRVVQDVQIAGLDYTSEGMVRSQLAMQPGDVLSHEALADARRRLYRTGAYTLVDVQTVELEPNHDLGPHQRAVRIAVNLREVQPYRLRYGAFYDTDRGPGGIADFSARNVIGNARLLGLRTRYDAQLHEARLYFSQPQLRRLPLRTDSVLFVQRDTRDAFTTDRLGWTLSQETRFWDHYIWSFGYRIEQTRTFETAAPLLAQSLRVAPLTTAFSRETRNDVLDATRGSFQAHSFEYAPAWLGSQLRYYKYFGQFFRYVGLTRPTEVPFVRGTERSRVVFAGGLRLGVAGGLEGQELIPPDRFFAGGGSTIRGFEQDSVGPTDPLGNPIGGDSVFIFNSELRFPLYWIVDGVGFLDMGNVYPRAADFRPWDVRKGAGLGLRVRTPYFLIRADYGWKLDRRPGESPGRIFFSIGQAF